MAKLVKCKTCGKEIAKSAKVCPYCGAKQKGHLVLGIVLTIVGIMLFSAGISGASKGSKKQTANVAKTEKQEVDAAKTEPEELIEWEITYQNYVIQKNVLGENELYAIVEVENTGNTDLYLDNATFDFEDDNGNLVATYSSMISSDPDIIAPGEKGYFYCNMASIDGDVDPSVNYTFVPNIKMEKSKHDIIRYNITDTSISDGGSLSPVTIIGRVENNTDEEAGLIWVACVLYRDDDTPIAAYGTNVTEVPAGETVSFSADALFLMNLGINYTDVARYEVYACKTQYQF